jgi:hypothetical protein
VLRSTSLPSLRQQGKRFLSPSPERSLYWPLQPVRFDSMRRPPGIAPNRTPRHKATQIISTPTVSGALLASVYYVTPRPTVRRLRSMGLPHLRL